MEGPNLTLYQDVLTKFPSINLRASGGIRGVDDFKILRELGVQSVLFGRAFFEGKISLNDIEKFLGENP